MIDATALRYALVGLVNTVVGLGCILLLQYGFDLRPTAANAIGFALGLLLSYVLNRRFAFRSQRAHIAAVPSFLLAAAASYLLNLLVLHVGLVRLGLNGVIAQAVAVLSYAVSFYLLNRYVVFTRLRA